METRRRSILGILVAALAAPCFAAGKVFAAGEDSTPAAGGCDGQGAKKELSAEEKEILKKLKNGMQAIDVAVRKALADAGLADKIDIAAIKYATHEQLQQLYEKAGKKYDRKQRGDCICACCPSGFYWCCYTPGCNPCP